MANIKSAKKRILVNQSKALQNQMVKSQLKTAIKKFETEANADQYSLTTSAIDKAVAKGVLHKNTANRKKARLAKKMVNA